jgi:hypothetical protein
MLGSTLAVLNGRKKFNLSELQKAIAKAGGGAIYDPSTLWGAADHLPRRNLLTSTATLATQTKTVTAVSHTLYIKGTGSVTLSGVATGTLSGTGASDRVSLVFTPTAGSLVMTVSGTVTEGHLTTTATTDHSYQVITDWTTEQYANAAAKNVPWLRRNMLTYTEDFSNAAWLKYSPATFTAYDSVTDPDGTQTADTYSNTATPGFAFVYRSVSVPSTTAVTFSIYIRKITGEYIGIALGNADFSVTNKFQIFNLDTPGVESVVSSGTDVTIQSASITAASNSFYKLTVTGSISGYSAIGVAFTVVSGAASVTRLANGSCYVWGAQLEVAGAATEYQAIRASWDAQYAANAAAAGVALTMYQDSAGATAVSSPDQPIGKLNDLSGGGYHAIQSGATGLKPVLRLCPNGCWYLERTSNQQLYATFPDLGASSIYLVDNEQMIEETGITINGSTPIIQYSQTAKPVVILKGTTSQRKDLVKYAGSTFYEDAADWTKVGPTYWKNYKQLRAKRSSSTADTLTTPTGTYPGTSAFVGAVNLPDGRVYCCPFSSTAARIYDPVTDTLTTPTGTFNVSNGWLSGVLMHDGRVYISPFSSTSARIYNPSTDSLITPTGTFSSTFAGSVVMADGRVFIVPFASTSARIYDPVTDTLTTPSGTFPVNSSVGGLLLGDGRVFCVPNSGGGVRIYNPYDNSLLTPSGTFTGVFAGGVLLADGGVYLIPQAASSAVIYNPSTNSTSIPTGNFSGVSCIGGCLLPDGRVYCIPFGATSARIYDPVTDTLTTPSGTFAGSSAFYSGVLMIDGRVFITPHNSASARIYNGGYPNQTSARVLSAYDNKL